MALPRSAASLEFNVLKDVATKRRRRMAYLRSPEQVRFMERYQWTRKKTLASTRSW
jgi:hypothetical protein